MKEFKNNSKFWLLALIIAMLFSIYFIIYIPMVNNLRAMTVENMHMAAHYKMTILERDINQAMVGARGISTRSLLKESLYKYSNGEMELAELKEISQNRFTDGIDTLEGLESAIRVTDGEIIASYNGEIDYDEELNKIEEITYSISPGSSKLKIVSPVESEGKLLGHDIFLFDLIPTIEKLDMENLKGILITEEERKALVSNTGFFEVEDNHLIAEDEQFIYHIERISNTDSYLYIPADKGLIYKSVSQVTKANLINFIIIGLTFVFTSTIITTKLAQGKIDELEVGRDKYRSQYLIDPLTGAFTRRALSEGREEKLISEDFKGIAVMMDLTDFKRINDSHGHKEGDRVLVKLVEIMFGSLREDDLVIRYGGDEFLVLLHDCEMEEAKSIINRIRQNFKKSSEFKYDVDFDYGMEIINSYGELNYSIAKSDERMYRNKVRGK